MTLEDLYDYLKENNIVNLSEGHIPTELQDLTKPEIEYINTTIHQIEPLLQYLIIEAECPYTQNQTTMSYEGRGQWLCLHGIETKIKPISIPLYQAYLHLKKLNITILPNQTQNLPI